MRLLFQFYLGTVAVFSTAGAKSGGSFGSSEYLIGSWQVEHGLPQNTVTCLTQTRDGYLWLGTFNGLARFDGLRFVVYGAHNTPELKSNRILSLLEDHQGRLWIGTEGGGVTRWEAGRFTTYTAWEGLAHDTVQCLCEDGSGQMWMGTAAGLTGWQEPGTRSAAQESDLLRGPILAAASDGKGRCGFLVDKSLRWLESGRWVKEETTAPNEETILGLHRGRSGEVWLFGEGLLAPLSASLGTTNYLPAGDEPQVQAVLESGNGDVWIGTRGGELRRLRRGQWVTISTGDDLGRQPVRCLTEDREGNVWVGTDGGGLVRLKPRWLTTIDARDGLANEFILSMSEDGADGVWLASHCGGITYWREGVARPWSAGGTLKPGTCVGPLLRTRDGSLWIGTSGEGLIRWKDGQATRYGRAQGLADSTILSLCETREGQLWIGTQEAGLFKFNQNSFQNFTAQDGFPARIITAIVQDQDGDLWIGSNGMGLYRYANGKFSLYSRREGWGGDFIRTLLVDAGGALWIGTGGSGLTRMKDGWFNTLTTRQGLGDDVVSQLLEDDFGHLWVGSNRGIFRVEKRAFEDFASSLTPSVDVVAYGKSEGMQSLECTGGFHPAGLKARDGSLWFSTVKGAVRIQPAKLAASGETNRSALNSPYNVVPPPVVIEEVWFDDELIRPPSPAGAPLVSAPGVQRVEFRYTGLSFTAPERVRFRYQLEGLDNEWVEANHNRSARFPQLPAGDYRFRVIACNSDGVWNTTGAELTFEVRPHFWRTRWFFAGSILLAGGVITGAIRLRERRKLHQKMMRLERQHAIEKERRRIAQDMHDELGSRLAKLSFLSELAKGSVSQPADMARRIDHIAQTSRAVLETLDEIVWAVNPQNDTLEHLAAYLGQYAQQFFQATPIECEVQMPVSLPRYPLAAETRHHLFLAVQEALGNVIKHARASRVQVTMTLATGCFIISVADNGCGLGAAAPGGHAPAVAVRNGNGLGNMRRRLDELAASFHIENRESGGTKVTFTLPLPVKPKMQSPA